MGLSIKVAIFSLLAGLALFYRGNVHREKFRGKVQELKAVKRNRDVMIEAERALYSGKMKTDKEVRDEIKRIKSGDRDTFPNGW